MSSKRTKWADEHLKNRRRRNRKLKLKSTGRNQNNLIDDISTSIAADAVFSNELVLESLFSKMSLVNLKSCRQVNSLWCDLATKELLKSYTTRKIWTSQTDSDPWDISVIINFDCGHRPNGLHRVESLETFLTLVDASAKFPCNHFSIADCHLSSRRIQDFLWRHGKNFKTLEIHKSHRPMHRRKSLETSSDLSLLHLLLTQQLLNLKTLKLFGIPNHWKKPSTLQTTSNLPCLTKLVVKYFTRDASKFLEKILAASVNLKSLKSLDLFESNTIFSDLIVNCGKSHLLKHLHFKFMSSPAVNLTQRYQQVEIYSKIAKAKPQLKSISCSCEFEDYDDFIEPEIVKVSKLYIDILNECLISSSHSLKEIDDFVSIIRLPGIQIPAFPKIKSLSLFNSDVGHPSDYVDLFEGHFEGDPVFYQGLDFVDGFPNLESITVIRQFHSGYYSHHSFEEVVKDIVPHYGVKKLVFWTFINPMPAEYARYFSSKFPNLTSVTFPLTYEFFEASQFIWRNLTKLEKLCVTVGINLYSDLLWEYIDGDELIQFPEIEAAFTGFSSKTCSRLRETIGIEDLDFNAASVSSELAGLRTNPSILDLKGLKKLVIAFDGYGNWKRCGLLLTKVTGIFAFMMCPELRVTINVLHLNDESDFRPEEWRPLKDIYPYVHEIRGYGRFR